MKINNFRVDLTDISARGETLQPAIISVAVQAHISVESHRRLIVLTVRIRRINEQLNTNN